MNPIFKIIANASVCEYCGKKNYKKTRIAKTAANAMTKEKGVPFSAYYCKPGKAWHVGRSHKIKIHKGNFHMTKDTVGLGIDPGNKGAICVVSDRCIEIHDYFSMDGAVSLLRLLNSKFSLQFTVLEKVWLQPRDVSHLHSADVLIKNFAMWHTLLHVLDIPHTECAPATWRKGLISSKKQKSKDAYLKKAMAIWPDQTFKRHDQAEAALMAYRAWQHIKAGWETRRRA